MWPTVATAYKLPWLALSDVNPVVAVGPAIQSRDPEGNKKRGAMPSPAKSVGIAPVGHS